MKSFKWMKNNVYKKWSPTNKIMFWLSVIGIIIGLFGAKWYFQYNIIGDNNTQIIGNNNQITSTIIIKNSTMYEEDLYLWISAKNDIKLMYDNKTYLFSDRLRRDTLHDVIYWPVIFKISNTGLKPIKLLSFQSIFHCNGELIDSTTYWGKNMYSEGVLDIGEEFESDYEYNFIVFNQNKFDLIEQPYICNVKFILKTSKKEYVEEINNFNYKTGLVIPEIK